jgi:orotidine-5'-phosphate decarboxylase
VHFTKKLKQILRERNTHLCIGLDSDIKKIPPFFQSFSNPVSEFNKKIIESTHDLVCAYKLNIAFYEKMGETGWTALRETLKSIPENVITIADAKRGDIENTTELYAQAYFDELGFDSITVQPYMGADSVWPFIKRKNKFVFLLALTSNFSAKEIQYLKVGKKYLYEVIIEKALTWNAHKIGFVVGANHPMELKNIASKYPETPLLIPGIGAQKNSLNKTVSSISHNLYIINQSRSIIYSAPKANDADEFTKSIRENAINARDEINKAAKTG